MTQTLLTVRYRLTGDITGFRTRMDAVATAMMPMDGLSWKIWGLDPEKGIGLSAYLFADAASARAFTEGPVIAGLRRSPGVAEVEFTLAPVDRALSLITGAEAALSPLA